MEKKPPAMEQYYSVVQLAAQLQISREKARLLVKDEPGVLKLVGVKKPMYRIPQSVVERIIRRSATVA